MFVIKTKDESGKIIQIEINYYTKLQIIPIDIIFIKGFKFKFKNHVHDSELSEHRLFSKQVYDRRAMSKPCHAMSNQRAW